MALSPAADVPSLPRTSIMRRVFSLFSMPLASIRVKAWRRPPLHCGGTLFLSVCGSLNRTITLSIFSWAIVVPPCLQKRVLFSGKLFFSLARSFLSFWWVFLEVGGEDFDGVKDPPTPKLCVCYCKGFFFSAHIKDMKRSQDFKDEDGLSVTVTSPQLNDRGWIRGQTLGTKGNIFTGRPVQNL